MRNSFFDALYEVACKDPSVVVVTADMGFNMLEKFRDSLPGQFVNAGISEANATSIAAGMAIYGKKPYIYSITNFVTYRCFEQVRLDVCYQEADVKIVGSGGGLDYGQSGPTHQATEDVAVMRSLPNMKVVCPCDPYEASALPFLLSKTKGPVFVRLGRGKEPKMHSSAPSMQIGKGIECVHHDEADASVFSTGAISYNAMKAVQKLQQMGVAAEHYLLPWVKPFDGKLLSEKAQSSKLLVFVEEHTAIGGLYGAACEEIASSGGRARVRSIALPDSFQKKAGDCDYLRTQNGLDADSIASRIASWVKN
jgi:transketolase